MLNGAVYFVVKLAICIYTIEDSISASDDPCQVAKIIPDSEYRGTHCSRKTGKAICDRYLSELSWYRSHANGVHIATSPVNLSMCATRFPIWINGTLPSLAAGEVSLTACVSHEDVCSFKLQIRAKNCDNQYYVYRFDQLPPACDAAFCFGENKACPPVDPCHWFYNNDLMHNNHDDTTCPPVACHSSSIRDWYVVGGKSDPLVVSNTCPVHQRCLISPIWFNYSMSMKINETAMVNACVSGKSSCCQNQYHIEVMRCPNFFVYKINPSEYCTEHVCIEGDWLCSESKTTTIKNDAQTAGKEVSPTRASKTTDIGLIVGIAVAVSVAVVLVSFVIGKIMINKRNVKRVGSELQKYF